MARAAGVMVLLREAAPRDWRWGNSVHTRNLRCMHDALQDGPVDAYPEEEFWQDPLQVAACRIDEAPAWSVVRACATCRPSRPGRAGLPADAGCLQRRASPRSFLTRARRLPHREPESRQDPPGAAGRLSASFVAMSTAGSHIAAGKLIPPATAGVVRAPFLPDLPTVSDSVPGFTATDRYGLIGSARLPAALRERRTQEPVTVLRALKVAGVLTRSGLPPAPGTREELSRYIDLESKTWAKVVVERKATAN